MDETLIKRLVEELRTAINESISGSEEIPEVIAKIEDNGYQVVMLLNATIAIKERDVGIMSPPARTNGKLESRFSPQDVQYLKSMHISVTG